MDIDATRLEESHIVVRKLMDSVGADGEISCHREQRTALKDADFVVVAFQIGGYQPCTVTDFEVCKLHGLEQTIADTLGPGGIMRALRTIPHLWRICEDMTEVCPQATMLNYVNPMAMNTGQCMRAIRILNRWGCAIRCRERRKNWRTISISTRRICAIAAQASTIWRSICRWRKTGRRQLRQHLSGYAAGLCRRAGAEASGELALPEYCSL